MATEDDPLNDDSSDAGPYEPGPRRSTFTPTPTPRQPAAPSAAEDAYDDDALANALAASLTQITNSIPIVPSGVDPVPAPVAPPTAGTVPPWANAPAPAPELVVDPGALRRSRHRPPANDEPPLLIPGGGGDTLSQIEQLEAQLRLRATDPNPSGPTRVRHAALPADGPAQAPPVAALPVPAVPPTPVTPPPAEPAHALPAHRADGHRSRTTGAVPTQADAPVQAPLPAPAPAPAAGSEASEPRSALAFERPALVEPPRHYAPPVAEEPLYSYAAPPTGPLTREVRADETGDHRAVIDELAAGALPEGFQPHSASASNLDAGFSFGQLVDGDPADGAQHARRTSGQVSAPGPAPETRHPVFIDPLPVMDADQVPVTTGSIPVIRPAYDVDLDDDVDEVDRADRGLGPVKVDTAGIAIVPEQLVAPSGPIPTIRIPSDEVILVDNAPTNLPGFSLEASGAEPTPLEHRAGNASRLFWLWFAANSSFISVALGAILFSLGMSLRQSVVAVLAGVAVSFLPLGLSTLAGKRTGQPTMVVSRASFGLIGNVLPSVIALATRLFWGGVLLWLLATASAAILVGASMAGGLDELQVTFIVLALGFLIAFFVAFAGFGLLARVQLVLSIVSVVLIIGMIAMTAQYVDISAALTTADGSWILVITGAVLVFSFVGLVWANSGGDLARYQRVHSSGARSMLWAAFATGMPAFTLIAYGALLAASNKGLALGLASSPIETLALILPRWYPIPLLAATALGLLSGIIITIYSAGFALQAIGVRLRREWAVLAVGLAMLGLTLVLVATVPIGAFDSLARDLATTLAVPTAAWAGIFASEMMIRKRRFETESLLGRGGVYPDVHWINLPMLVVASILGFGLCSATVGWLGWQGFLFSAFGVPLDSELAMSDLGVFVALAIGLLTPIVAGIPAIRQQESTRV